MLAVALALGAAVAWGLADFGAGHASRRTSVVFVLFVMEASGLAVSALVVAGTSAPGPDARCVVLAGVAGIAGAGGLGFAYRALAVGKMSVVAPLTATGGAVPLIVGCALGHWPPLLAALGLATTAVGVVVAAWQPRGHAAASGPPRRAGVGLALLSSIGIGMYFLASDPASDVSVLWTLVISRAVGLPVIAAIAVRSARAHPYPTRRILLGLAALGCFDLAATWFVGLANTHGDVAVVSVIASMYPLFTVALACGMSKERLSPTEAAGGALSLLGVGLIAST